MFGQKKIVDLVENKKIEKEVSVATTAMSIDPHCERYYWISPYAYCANNPVKYVDPDGRDIAVRFYGEGTAQEFVNMMNKSLDGQYEVYFAKGAPEGYVLLGVRAIDGGGDVSKMTENGQAFLSELAGMINNRDVVSQISIVNGRSDVQVGNYTQNMIDIADVNQFNDNGTFGATKAGKMTHELVEQFNKAKDGLPIGNGLNYDRNHSISITAEDRVNGNKRDRTYGEKQITRSTISSRFIEKDGTVTRVYYDSQKKGVMQVRQVKGTKQ